MDNTAVLNAALLLIPVPATAQAQVNAGELKRDGLVIIPSAARSANPHESQPANVVA